MIKVAIRTHIQRAWIEVNYPNHMWGNTWWEGIRWPDMTTAGWVYIECDDAEAAQIALTLGTEVERVESCID